MYIVFFFLMIRRPPRSTLFPYTSSSDLAVGEAGWKAVAVIELLLAAAREAGVPILYSAGTGEQGRWLDKRPVHARQPDRKSTRLNSSHANISYAVFCLKKKIKTNSQSHW